MNLDNIFGVFNNFDDDSNNQVDETSLLIDFSDHPLYWISGFIKIIDNYTFFTEKTVKMYKNISPDMNIEDLEKGGEELMYRKAWDYIKPFKVDNPFHVECLRIKADSTMVIYLQSSIKFFEALEEYEKCALLKAIENKIKEILK
jgi:hypothetical protein